MIQTLEGMSGKTHRVFRESKNVTEDKARLFWRMESKVTYTYTVKEMPVITYNDMAFINRCNSIVFRAGDSPVWNRNETILPMSWRLFQNTITQPGKEYSLQSVPSLSTAIDFDVRKNQPDFYAMWEKRKKQARYVKDVEAKYKEAYGYTDHDIEQMDPNVYAAEIMALVNQTIREKLAEDAGRELSDLTPEDMRAMLEEHYMAHPEDLEDNQEVLDAAASAKIKYDDDNRKRYAGGRLARTDITHGLDVTIVKAFRECRAAFFKDPRFQDRGDGNLWGMDGTLYIRKLDPSENLDELNRAAESKDTRVFGDGKIDPGDLNEFQGFAVYDAFLRFLKTMDNWSAFADGKFEQAMVEAMRRDEEAAGS